MILGLGGLVTTIIVGLRATDVARHISFGIFSTLVTLLAHSMMMFYLIGKGKAVKDAMAEHNLAGDHYRRIAMARKPVFSIGTLAMALTMVTAILGASVDTGVLPPIVHGAGAATGHRHRRAPQGRCCPAEEAGGQGRRQASREDIRGEVRWLEPPRRAEGGYDAVAGRQRRPAPRSTA